MRSKKFLLGVGCDLSVNNEVAEEVLDVVISVAALDQLDLFEGELGHDKSGDNGQCL